MLYKVDETQLKILPNKSVFEIQSSPASHFLKSAALSELTTGALLQWDLT